MLLSKRTRQGITLLEMLIAVAILAILAVITFTVFSNFKRTSALNIAAEDAVSLLIEARSKTLSSKEASQYGVHFETSKAVLFKGITYSAGDPANVIVDLPSGVEVSAIALQGGGSDVIFSRLIATTVQYGTVTLRSTQDITKTRIITIQSTGAVSL